MARDSLTPKGNGAKEAERARQRPGEEQGESVKEEVASKEAKQDQVKGGQHEEVAGENQESRQETWSRIGRGVVEEQSPGNGHT